ncbi:MAG: hypothetical protein CMK09_02465 [Ponticaulis sp.]|nr:hypothetical protein [Ponticaulis sp.]|tara:strand:+ start:13104 stop:14213 length:1110 start_codon:yes stop_codon:yes gene_type:complete
MNKSRNSLRLYLLGLALIALLTTTGHELIERVIRQNGVYGSVINLAGRQRMLSQRIALTAHTLDDGAASDTGARLNALVDEMSRAHDALANGNDHPMLLRAAPNDPRLDALYSGVGGLSDTMDDFLSIARRAANAGDIEPADLEVLMQLSDDTLLSQLEQAVSTYETMAGESARRAALTSTLLWLATLLMLVLEWFLIFRPQHRFGQAAMRKIREQKDEIAAEQARYELAADAASFGVWEQPDIALPRLVLTPTFATALGLEPDALPRDRGGFLKRIHPEDIDAVCSTLFGPPKHNREQSSVEHRFLCGDGTYRYFLTVGEHRPSFDNNSYRLVAYSIDIHDRKTAEALSQDYQARIEALPISAKRAVG